MVFFRSDGASQGDLEFGSRFWIKVLDQQLQSPDWKI
jgi:hypothetical protein